MACDQAGEPGRWVDAINYNPHVGLWYMTSLEPMARTATHRRESQNAETPGFPELANVRG
jgi:hypothetical protein